MNLETIDKTNENTFKSKGKGIGNYINLVENNYKRSVLEKEDKINVGDIIRVGYLIPEGNKERTQYYEGLIIAKNNRGLGQTFTLRRSVQGIGVEQIFFFHSPKIVSINKKQSSKVRRAKLYFIRNLRGKASRLKPEL
jgi:large subunit ribosomal protein L19